MGHLHFNKYVKKNVERDGVIKPKSLLSVIALT